MDVLRRRGDFVRVTSGWATCTYSTATWVYTTHLHLALALNLPSFAYCIAVWLIYTHDLGNWSSSLQVSLQGVLQALSSISFSVSNMDPNATQPKLCAPKIPAFRL